MKKKISIEGMSCGHCVKHVNDALNEINGVTNVNVSLDDKSAIINAANEVEDQTIKSAIEDVGYEVVSIVEM